MIKFLFKHFQIYILLRTHFLRADEPASHQTPDWSWTISPSLLMGKAICLDLTNGI